MKIIGIIESGTQWHSLLREHLGTTIYKFVTWSHSDHVADFISSNQCHLLLIGPGFPFLEITRKLRYSGDQTPIVVIEPFMNELDAVLALEMGVDDIVTDETRRREVIARVKRILRYYQPQFTEFINYEGRILDAGKLTILPDSYTIIINGETKSLSNNEMLLLQHLFENKGEVVPREELIKVIGGNTNPRAIDTYVSNLRNKIGEKLSNATYIVTIRYVGYRFDIPSTMKEK